MPTFDRAEREGSRDGEMAASRHGHSHSLSIPMWDSSDPDRAPPPLPVPPGSPSLQTRANASANIQAAAQKLSERATSQYTTNPMPPVSPDKSLIKGAQHRRMQSLQQGSVKDLRSYLDGMRTGSPERPSSRSALEPSFSPDRLSTSPERDEYFPSPERGSTTPTPTGRDPLKDTPSLRPATRSGARSILGENTPPSATMLALQSMANRDSDSPLGDITNASFRTGNQNWDSIASQISNLTSISLALQKEMSQLNRRSRDNATDLVSLKDAANTRDEDIRKSLKDLVSTIGSDAGSVFGRSSSFGLGLLDKSFASPPSASKPTFGSLPRSNSHNSLFEPGSPNPFSVEGAASVAMLEKIIREMVTKDGQERLLTTLNDILDRHSKDNVATIDTARKVEELADFIKSRPESQALIRTSPDPDAGHDDNKSKALEAMSADIIRLLHQIKESASKSGGLSSEIKSRLHDLRGEVLGMGRELGKKLEDTSLVKDEDRSLEVAAQTTADVERIVNEGMGQLKDHIETIIRESSQQLVAANPDKEQSGEEMFAAVKQALAEHSSAIVPAQPDGLDREGILEAVKEAYEEFKPEIELQQFGLERDEILQVLKEGLLDYQQTREPPPAPGASMDEVLNAIQQALQDFNPPRAADEMMLLREDLLSSVRGVLEGFKPAESATLDTEATRAAVMEAVKEGLAEHGPNAPREIEISRDDLFDAVKASLDGTTIPFNSFGEQVLQQLQTLVNEMKVEFQQYSAANGRDTEQVLDAVKDGLEVLRVDVEQYVDRAQDVTGKDEIVDVVRTGLENLRVDVQGYVAEGPTNGRSEMLDYIKAEFEHLHEAIGNGPTTSDREGDENRPSSTSEILAALESGFKGLEGQVGNRGLLDETNEEVMEAMKAEFDSLRDAVIAGSAGHKDEVIQAIQESLGSVREKVGGEETVSGSQEEVMGTVKEEFGHLREVLTPLLLRQGAAADKDEIIDSINQAVDGLREHISTSEGAESAQTLVAIKEQIDNLHQSFSGGLVRTGGDVPESTFDDIKARLDEIAAGGSNSGMTSDLLEAIQGEFEQLRQSVSQTMVQGGSRADTEEVLDTVRLGLDDLRSHLDKKLDNPENHMALNNQLLDALNEGIEAMKLDVTKAMDKPTDATLNYEILETLKSGLADLRTDMEKLTTGSRPSTAKGAELVLADMDAEGGETREMPTEGAAAPTTSPLRERMEVLFAQLQIKVEGMAASLGDIPSPEPVQLPEGITLKEDLIGLEDMLRDVQAALAAIAAKETAEVENAVTKEDTDAIETLLRNTKAQIEELPLPDPATFVTKEHLDNVEAVVRIAHEAVEGLTLKVDENSASKADLAVVEVLVKDLTEAFNGLKEGLPKAPEEGEEEEQTKLTKTDLDVLGILCTEIKDKIAELALPDVETLPTKSDIEQLSGLINDFRESHDKVKESYEQDISVTAQAFDDRKKEAEELAEQVATIKVFLEEVKDEILNKVTEGESSMTTLGETLKGVEENVSGGSGVGADVKELLETVKNEFERAHSSLEGIKVDHEQNGATLLEKHGEHKDAIVAAVIEKVDTCYDGLMSKYDDAQTAAEEKAKMMEEKALEQQEILASTKEMTDDLKLSIDTLGSSLTTFIPAFTEANEKMSEDHKTLFEKVDGTVLTFAESHETQKAEHQATRDEVARTIDGVSGLQADFTEYHPRFLMELKEIFAVVNQHYEHSKTLVETAEQHANSVREQVVASAEESKTHVNAPFEGIKSQLDELKGQTASLHEALKENLAEQMSAIPALLPPPVEAAPVEKYDDTGVHEKLDTLVNLAGEAGMATAQMARLDEIQEQVKATAAEVSAFVAMQNRAITEGNESKEREAEEVAILLERRLVQKDTIEAEITSLNDEKSNLTAVVEALRAEKEALVAQKSRLNADVSSLQTALDIRREELHNMDAKADALERRILEGLIDHSRAMLLTKQTPRNSPKKPQGRDLRNTSGISSATISASPVPSPLKNHALAMKTRPSMKRNSAAPNSGERRIMSLSQISRNIPSGAAAFSTPTPSLVSAAGQLSRSHSVKNHKLRKPEWVPTMSALGGNDKENDDGSVYDYGSETDNASSHYDSRPVSRDRPMSRDSMQSGNETERRSVSYAGTAITGSDLTYGTGSSYTEGITPTDDGRRTSYGTYDTGSYMTGSEIDHEARRRSSIGSTIKSTVGAETIQEDDEEEEDDGNVSDLESEIQRLAEQAHREHLAEQEAQNVHSDGKEIVAWAPPSDSGLGTDLPTAQATGSENSYFPGHEHDNATTGEVMAGDGE